MSEIRIAVLGADRLDLDHHLALNQLSDQGRVTAFALDTPPLPEGLNVLQQTMQNEQLDGLLVAGDRADLRAWVCFALTQGWPVYSTHPTPPSIEDMIEIRREEQNAAQPILQFAMTGRHHDSVLAAQAKAQSGEFGRLLTLRGLCGVLAADQDESPIFGPAAQLIDLMQMFAGPFQDISGFSDLDRTEIPGSETNICASLRTHSGVLANLHISSSQWRPTFRLELGLERGYMWLEGLNTERHNFGHEVLVYAQTDGSEVKHETVDRFDDSDGAKASLEAFIHRLSNPDAAPVGTSQIAFDTLNTLQRILAADPIYTPLEERHVS